jgi:hypothetical protein
VRRFWSILVAVALAACGNNAVVGPQFHGPVSMAWFNGFTHAHPGTQAPYLAVANSRTDELRIIDLSNNSALLSPGMAFPLSVPTDPFPMKVASAPIGDGGPDVVVVASSGELSLQIVTTWDASKGSVEIDQTTKVDLTLKTGINANATVLSLLGVRLPSSSPPKARIFVGLSGGQLVVVDFVRADPSQPVGPVVAVMPLATRQNLLFDPVDLAMDASGTDTTTLYCATPDLITDSDQHAGFQTFGVAGIQTTAAATDTWKIRAYKAGPGDTIGAPTRLVAAAVVAERDPANPEHFLAPASVPRVYAVLDEADAKDSSGMLWGCGLHHEIACGIVTIDPSLDPTTGGSTSLAPDPAQNFASSSVPAQTYRAPIVLPAEPLAFAVALPPASGSQRCVPGPTNSDPTCQSEGITSDGAATPFLVLAPGTGQRWTTAAMVVGASDGNSYVIDLGRMAAADDVSLLNDDTTRTKVTIASSVVPGGASPSASGAGLGLFNGVNPPPVIDSATMASSITVTPGYTQADAWTITNHGALPGLVSRVATVANDGTNVWVALQTPNTASPESLGDIADPALGVRVGDYVDVILPNPGTCAQNVNTSGNGQGRGFVTAILAPDPTKYPGGALAIQALSTGDPEITSDGLGTFCFAPPGQPPTALPVTITVRTSGLVLAGAKFGYAGRPVLDPPADQPSFGFQWTDESTSSPSLISLCPDTPKAAHQAAWTASAGSRTACETIAVARKARRFYYPEELCAAGQACQTNNWYPNFINGNALTTGPALQFRVGAYPPASTPLIGSVISFTTESGVQPMARVPASVSTPSAALSFDRSDPLLATLNSSAANDGTVFYVTYLGDVMMEFPPGQPTTGVATLR